MALVTCEDCGKDISDQALACPNCGRPMVSKPEPDEAEPVPELAGEMNWKRVAVFTVVLFLATAAAAFPFGFIQGYSRGAPPDWLSFGNFTVSIIAAACVFAALARRPTNTLGPCWLRQCSFRFRSMLACLAKRF
jgi:hypothetical protein